MRHAIASLAALLLAALIITSAKAELENENLLVTLPEGFVSAFKDRKGNALINELIPKGETLDAWSEMVTVQIFFGGLATTPDAFFTTMQQGWLKACPGATGKLIRTGTENGYAFAFGFLTCPKNPQTGKPEATWVKTIAGKDSFYAVQRATKGPATEAVITRFSSYLASVKVCDTRRPESPCS